jgi:putative ABC transport system substrate-binding protein
MIRRRQFITLLGAAAATPFMRPHLARAQQAMPVIGFFHSAQAAGNEYVMSAFRRGLNESGYVVGRNVAVEQQWAEGHYDRLAGIAADYIRRGVTVIVAGGGNAPAEAVKQRTDTIPIVFVSGDDPVKAGLVASLSRPGANITGIVFFNSVLVGKRLELLHQLLPSARTIAYFVNPGSLEAAQETATAQKAARALGLELQVLPTASPQDIDHNFAKLAQLPTQAALMAADPYLGSRHDQIAANAAHYAIPVMGSTQVYVRAGCLMSYSTSNAEAYRAAGRYVGRILKGEKPGDLPVQQSTKFEFVINLKTAKTLGLTIPPTLLALADEVIE